MSKKLVNPGLLCVFSGLLTALSFSYENTWFIAFFSVVPFYLAMTTDSPRAHVRFRRSYLFSFVYYVALLPWLLMLREVLPLSELLGAFVMVASILLIAAILSLFTASAMCFYHPNRNKPLLNALQFSFLYILAEHLQGLFTPLSFPWGRFAAILTPFTAFIQSAALLGGLFVSLLCVFVNCLLSEALLLFPNRKRDALLPLSILVCVFLVNTVGGAVRIAASDDYDTNSSALIVQGNFSGLAKWHASTEEIMQTYIDATIANIDESTEYVLYPETAIPLFLFERPAELDIFKSLAAQHDITIVMGIRYRTSTEPSAEYYNAMIAISPDGSVSEPYFKQVLVPLGEYMPFLDYFRENYPDILDVVGYYTAGNSSGAIHTPSETLGGIICYESIFPAIVRETVSDGAEVLMLISNDSWFGDSAALREHHAQAILRAVENNRWLLRSSSTAITSCINPVGEVVATAPYLTTAALKCDFSFSSERSLYSYVGDIVLIPSVLLVFYYILRGLKRYIIKRK